MEDMMKKRRVLSKPPLYPDYSKSFIRSTPFKMGMNPSSSASTNLSTKAALGLPKGASESVAGPGESVGDLNDFPVDSLEVGYDMEYENNKINYTMIIPTLDEAIENEQIGRDMDRDEERKLRRTVSNRLSAQRSRMKKSQYIAEMKQKMTDLQENVSYLHPALETYKQKKMMLKMQKTILENQLESCTNQSILLNKQIEEKRDEIRRLKELYLCKREHMMMMNGRPNVANSSASLFLPHYEPENYPRIAMNPSHYQCELIRPMMEVKNTRDDAGIERCLNLGALALSSTPATDLHVDPHHIHRPS